jgi:hypothetical protein
MPIKCAVQTAIIAKYILLKTYNFASHAGRLDRRKRVPGNFRNGHSHGNGNGKLLILHENTFPFPAFPVALEMVQISEFIDVPVFPVFAPLTEGKAYRNAIPRRVVESARISKVVEAQTAIFWKEQIPLCKWAGEIQLGTSAGPIAFADLRRMQMPDSKIEPYTVEQLQQQYAVSLQVAVGVMEQFSGDRSRIDKFLKRWPQKRVKPVSVSKN